MLCCSIFLLLQHRIWGRDIASASSSFNSSIASDSLATGSERADDTISSSQLIDDYCHLSVSAEPPLLVDSAVDKTQLLHLLQQLQLPPTCIGCHQRPLEFLLDKYDLRELSKFSVSFFDHIPQENRKDLQDLYYTV
jgi:hypothetical protein